MRDAVLYGKIQSRTISAGLSTRLYFREQHREVTRHGYDLTAICKHRNSRGIIAR